MTQKEQNQGIQEYLESLTPTEATEYSLWKATRRLKRPLQHNPPIKNEDNTWARNDKGKSYRFFETSRKRIQTLPLNAVHRRGKRDNRLPKYPIPNGIASL